jgi:hypothetical protein
LSNILKFGGASCAKVCGASIQTNMVAENMAATALRRSFMVPAIPGRQLVQMLDHVVVLQQIEMLDNAVVSQQADIRVTHLLWHLELIDARRRQAAAMMHHDRDPKYCRRRRTHRDRWATRSRQAAIVPPTSTPSGLDGAQFAPQLDHGTVSNRARALHRRHRAIRDSVAPADSID